MRAIHNLIRNPFQVLTTVLTLAAGIAASSAVFTLADALLFRPLPFPEPGQLAALTGTMRGNEPTSVSWQDVRDINRHASSIAAAAAYRLRTWGFSDTSEQPLEVVLSAMVTERFFEVLRVPARLEKNTIWLTNSFWISRFQGNPSVIGATISLNEEHYRVAGVLPAWFRMTLTQGEPSVVIPLDEKSYCCERGSRTLEGIVRFSRPGGDSELAALSHQFATAFADSNREFEFSQQDLRVHWAGDRRKPTLLLLSAVLLLMLVAAANAGGILLARASANVREAAIKTSLGATAWSLAAEQIWQGLAIGVGAGGVGFLGAVWILALAKNVPPLADSIASYKAAPDLRVAGFSIAIGIVSAVAASLAPLAAMRGRTLERILRMDGTATSSSKSIVRARFVLLVTQFALTAMLLFCGVALLRNLQEILSANLGFSTDQVVLAGIGIPESRYDTDEKMIAFHQQVIANLKRIPGIVDAGGGASLPVGAMSSRLLIDGQPQTPVNERSRTALSVASPEMFALLQIPVLRGNGFVAEHRYNAPLKVIVNELFVSKFLSGHDPIGQVVQLGFYNGAMKPWQNYEIAGVVGNTRNRGIDLPAEPQVYLSSEQIPLEGFLYFARTSRDAASLVNEFREAVWQVDRNIQAITPRPLAQHVEQRLGQRKVVLFLLGAFATFSLLFAASGLATGMAAVVAESQKEMGIRAALGESPAGLMMRVLGRGLHIAIWGFFLGIAGSIVAIRWISALVSDVSTLEFTAFLPVAAVLTLAVLAACWWPAFQASRTDPALVLRQ